MKRFERSNGLDTALYKNYPIFFTFVSIAIYLYVVRRNRKVFIYSRNA